MSALRTCSCQSDAVVCRALCCARSSHACISYFYSKHVSRRHSGIWNVRLHRRRCSPQRIRALRISNRRRWGQRRARQCRLQVPVRPCCNDPASGTHGSRSSYAASARRTHRATRSSRYCRGLPSASSPSPERRPLRPSVSPLASQHPFDSCGVWTVLCTGGLPRERSLRWLRYVGNISVIIKIITTY